MSTIHCTQGNPLWHRAQWCRICHSLESSSTEIDFNSNGQLAFYWHFQCDLAHFCTADRACPGQEQGCDRGFRSARPRFGAYFRQKHTKYIQKHAKSIQMHTKQWAPISSTRAEQILRYHNPGQETGSLPTHPSHRFDPNILGFNNQSPSYNDQTTSFGTVWKACQKYLMRGMVTFLGLIASGEIFGDNISKKLSIKYPNIF